MLVLRLRNGLDGLGVRSQAEVANELGISRQRVVKLERMAVERLERTVGNG